MLFKLAWRHIGSKQPHMEDGGFRKRVRAGGTLRKAHLEKMQKEVKENLCFSE